MLAAAFQTLMGPSSGPQVLLFKRFQSQWKQIDQPKFQPAVCDPSVKQHIAPLRDELLASCGVQHIWRPLNHEMTTWSSLSSLSSSWGGGGVSQHVIYASWNRGKFTMHAG